MRALLFVVLTACGGGPSSNGEPGVIVSSSDCNRLGPDGTGFMLELQYQVTLAPGQAVIADVVFPTSSPEINRSDIYNCGPWSNSGSSGLDQGCQRDPGQEAVSTTVFHSLAIEFADEVFPPATFTVIPKVLSAPGSNTMVGNNDLEMVTCN
jgi:hypothetical protein